jgi:hypothetical protein
MNDILTKKKKAFSNAQNFIFNNLMTCKLLKYTIRVCLYYTSIATFGTE